MPLIGATGKPTNMRQDIKYLAYFTGFSEILTKKRP